MPNIVIQACKNNTGKCICRQCLTRRFGFVYLRFETVKWLDYNRYTQLTRWCSGTCNASALGSIPGYGKSFFV